MHMHYNYSTVQSSEVSMSAFSQDLHFPFLGRQRQCLSLEYEEAVATIERDSLWTLLV